MSPFWYDPHTAGTADQSDESRSTDGTKTENDGRGRRSHDALNSGGEERAGACSLGSQERDACGGGDRGTRGEVGGQAGSGGQRRRPKEHGPQGHHRCNGQPCPRGEAARAQDREAYRAPREGGDRTRRRGARRYADTESRRHVQHIEVESLAGLSAPNWCEEVVASLTRYSLPATGRLAARWRALKRNLKVPCDCARNVISGAKR